MHFAAPSQWTHVSYGAFQRNEQTDWNSNACQAMITYRKANQSGSSKGEKNTYYLCKTTTVKRGGRRIWYEILSCVSLHGSSWSTLSIHLKGQKRLGWLSLESQPTTFKAKRSLGHQPIWNDLTVQWSLQFRALISFHLPPVFFI